MVWEEARESLAPQISTLSKAHYEHMPLRQPVHCWLIGTAQWSPTTTTMDFFIAAKRLLPGEEAREERESSKKTRLMTTETDSLSLVSAVSSSYEVSYVASSHVHRYNFMFQGDGISTGDVLGCNQNLSRDPARGPKVVQTLFQDYGPFQSNLVSFPIQYFPSVEEN